MTRDLVDFKGPVDLVEMKDQEGRKVHKAEKDHVSEGPKVKRDTKASQD